MRIAHVSDCYLPRLGGIELQVHDLAQRQAMGGHAVSVITSSGGPRSDDPSTGSTVVRVGRANPHAEKIYYRHSGRGPEAVERGGFDVVHVHASTFSPLTFLTARHAANRGIPTVATVHSLWARATPLFHAADRLTGWADWPVTWSAVSNAAAMPLRRILNGRAPVTVLPNGVSPEVWQVGHVARTPGELRLTAVMRLAPRKRPLQLARMLLDVHRRLPAGTRIRVEIIGDGPEQGRLQRFVQRHQMTDWFRLCGRLTRAEIRATFARSDLFVAPAALESFGIAALEARCAGLPILALSGTGVEDFVIHGRDGWLVDSDAAMADTILGLGASVSTLAQVAAHNRRVLPSINWPMVLNGCDALYQSATLQHGLPWQHDPTAAAIKESVAGH